MSSFVKQSKPQVLPAEVEMKNLKIDGLIDGGVDARSITVLEGARIEGDVGADCIVIHGVVRGIIRAAAIAVKKTALVEGELRYQTLTIDPSARVEAHCVPF
ncbi:MAG TPA: polymer-forming cytoskeletal protein [Rhodospirillales bacterium]|jgi:cytoskeletal protein CcmA (bactofilin family)|nr:polymer-forming cytoskeletal protein [Rhodospirillales bacterium]